MKRYLAGLMAVFLVGAMSAQHNLAFLNSPVRKLDLPLRGSVHSQSLAFELIRGMIYVEGKIGDRSGVFILDTGAPYLVINEKPDPTATAVQAHGAHQALAVAYTQLPSFSWAGETHQRITAIAVDISHLDGRSQQPLLGLIGYELFKDDELFIDYQRNLLLRSPARRAPTRGMAEPLARLSFELSGHLPVVTLRIGERSYRFGIDTGAAANLLDLGVAKELERELYTMLPSEELQGLDQLVAVTPALTVSGLQLGTTSTSTKFLATDLSRLTSATGVDIDGLLGYEFLRRFKVAINYPRKEICLW